MAFMLIWRLKAAGWFLIFWISNRLCLRWKV